MFERKPRSRPVVARLRKGAVTQAVNQASAGIGILATISLALAESAFSQGALNPALERSVAMLIQAYPDQLSHVDGNYLVWRDGTRMVIDDGVAKDQETRLDQGDIEDMLAQLYPIGRCSYAAPAEGFDPGRVRDEVFLRAMYGQSEGEVAAQLVTIDWFGTPLRVTTINGVDQALLAVRDELARLPAAMHPVFERTAGTFNWRPVAGTDRLSVHSFGAAIDLNVAFADYWLWGSPTGREADVPPYRNRVPAEIVEVFERHGFIWGGKWYHFDTMHFEYRPELLALAVAADC